MLAPFRAVTPEELMAKLLVLWPDALEITPAKVVLPVPASVRVRLVPLLPKAKLLKVRPPALLFVTAVLRVIELEPLIAKAPEPSITVPAEKTKLLETVRAVASVEIEPPATELVTAPLPRAKLLPITRPPPVKLTPPENELLPDSVRVPAPA